MATTLINADIIQKHSVQQYKFKSLGSSGPQEEVEFTSSLVNPQEPEEAELEEEFTEENHPSRRASDVDSSALSKGSKDALIESLLKKTDEMSSNFIKLQMKLEDKEKEYAESLEQVKQESYNEGLESGRKQASEQIGADVKAGLSQFASSVASLENAAKEYENALEAIKADLIAAAVDIAQEVVQVEVSTHSSEVAKKLSDALIQELQSASKITLKVNPVDHGAVSEHVGELKNVQIVSDSAVSAGGVIANSEVANIDSQISARFEKVKRAALSE